MSGLSYDESLSSNDPAVPLPVDQHHHDRLALYSNDNNGVGSASPDGVPNTFATTTTTADGDHQLPPHLHHHHHESHLEPSPENTNNKAGSHKSPTPHYSTALSAVDQALLQLPPSERTHVNHLLADNGTLRARVKALTQELNDARDIFSRRGKLFLSRLSSSDTNKKTQTRDLKGLPPLRTVKKQGGSIEDLDGPAKFCQTDESFLEDMAPVMAAGQKDAMEQLEKLKAEKARRAAAKAAKGKTKQDALNTAAGGDSKPTPVSADSPRDGDDDDDDNNTASQPNIEQILNAEIMKVKAECASLQHQIELLRAGGATHTPEVQAAHSTTMKRVDELYRALLDSISKVSAAEAQVSELKANQQQQQHSPSSQHRRGGGASSHSQAVKPVQYSKSSNTDRVLDMNVSSIPPLPHQSAPETTATSDYVNSLERALESTRAQLNTALKQLEDQSNGAGAASERLSVASVISDRVLGDNRRSVAVSTGASVASRVEDLFGKYNVPFSPEVVEDMLKNKDAPTQLLELQKATQEKSLDFSSMTSMSTALATEVDALRNELLASHVAMDEMQYSLDLERRAGPASTEKANNSAAKDIAILCDVVHASKAEIEHLREQNKDLTRERNIAVNDFKQLQEHFRNALVTSEKLVESQQDASDETQRRLHERIRNQENEAISLKADISTLHREVDKHKKQKEAAQKDVFILRERTSQLQSSLATLRSENTSLGQEIRQLRAHSGLSRSNAAASRSGDDLANTSNSTSRGAGASAAGTNNRGAVSRRATTPTQNVGRNATSGRANQQHQQTSSNFSSTSELEAQYEELRGCFLDLAALVPGDLQTARQVSDRLIKDFRALQARVAHLEKDLRKRMATMANAKTAADDAKSKQLAAEQKARTLQTANKRAGHSKKVAEDAAKQFDSKFDVMAASREDLAAKVEILEGELEATRDALVATRNEVEIGRKLMLSLINDDDNDMGQLVADTEHKLQQSHSPSSYAGTAATTTGDFYHQHPR